MAAAVLLFVLINTAAVHAAEYDRYLIREYSISVTVENVEAAFEIIENMPGLSLSSQINADFGFAHTNKRVNASDFDEALATLRGLGEVNHFNSNARNVFSEVNDLRSELLVREGEYRRLMELLTEVAELEHFVVIENRISRVIENLEHIRGRLNNLSFETGTVIIFINLAQEHVEITPARIDTPLQRIGHTFVNSAAFTLSAVQVILVALVFISIPLIILLGGAWFIWKFFRRKPKEEVNVFDERR